MKTAIVTGVDRGLGLAFANRLLKEGWRVIGTHLLEQEETLKKLKEVYGELLLLFEVNIGNDESVRAFESDVKNTVEYVDMLINNAGILGKTEDSIYDELDYEDMLRTYNVNTLGTLRVTNAVIDLVMKSNAMLVVNISSEAASIGNNTREAWYGYCLSKAAVNMSGDITHQRIKGDGGRVIQFHPGYLKTFMLGHYNEDGKLTGDEAAEAILCVVEEVMAGPVEDKAIYIDYEGNRMPW